MIFQPDFDGKVWIKSIPGMWVYQSDLMPGWKNLKKPLTAEEDEALQRQIERETTEEFHDMETDGAKWRDNQERRFYEAGERR